MALLARRHLVDRTFTLVALALTLAAVYPLVSVVWEVVRRGAPAINVEFLTGLPASPILSGGGIVHALIGTAMVVGIGSAIGVPIGVLAGTFLAEYRQSRVAFSIRLVADVMAGIPSIVAGLFGYALVVSRIGYSAIAGGVALALIMLPTVTRTTEEAMRTVPDTYREAAMALGAPRWHGTLRVVWPAALPSLLTGILLGVARIAGETAPLLLTVLTSFYMVTDPQQPVATLPYLVYDYGKSAYPTRVAQAWGAALVLLAFVLLINIAVRLLAYRRSRLLRS